VRVIGLTLITRPSQSNDELVAPAITEPIPTPVIEEAAQPPAAVEDEVVPAASKEEAIVEPEFVVEVAPPTPAAIEQAVEDVNALSSNQASESASVEQAEDVATPSDKDDGETELGVEAEMTFASPSPPSVPVEKLPEAAGTHDSSPFFALFVSSDSYDVT